VSSPTASLSTTSPFWRFAAVVGFFLLIWPLISVILLWLTRFNDEGWVDSAGFYLIYGYPLFVPSAVLAGVICAVAAVRFGYNSVWIAVGAALAAGAALLAVAVFIIPSAALARGNIAIGLGFTFLMSLIASLICWRLSRRFARVT
jgi:hypothetical protein